MSLEHSIVGEHCLRPYGPAHIRCTCGLTYIAEYMLGSRAYDYERMRRLMDEHIATA